MTSPFVKNKPIGGEQEFFNNGNFYGVTNSGRSSLRWIIQSMQLQEKRVLVPDFICQIVIDIMNEYDIEAVFYKINDNFEFTVPPTSKPVDAIYIIRYFGHNSASFQSILTDSTLPIIIDDVFGTEVPPVKASTKWCYFNSLRKISAVSAFSQIISNTPLLDIQKGTLPAFSDLKYQAKEAKAKFIHSREGNENQYLATFSDAENLLDNSVGIFSADDKSIYLANQFYQKLAHTKAIHQKNLTVAKRSLSQHQFVDITPEYPTFLPLILKNRDNVRLALMEHAIYLAVHWPEIKETSNKISSKILSLPLDARYTPEDIQHLCKLIQKFDQ